MKQSLDWSPIWPLQQEIKGRGGGQMVSGLALYSDNPCLNTATVLSVHGLKKPKMNVKEAGMDHLPKNQVTNTIVLCTYFFAVVV